MPTYEYVCKACGHEFEEFQSITAKSLKKCPHCTKLQLRRKIGIGAGIIFKGSGFYETDYRSDSYSKAAKADKDASTGKSESTGDSKPAEAKSESKAETKAESKAESTSASKSADSKPAEKKPAKKEPASNASKD